LPSVLRGSEWTRMGVTGRRSCNDINAQHCNALMLPQPLPQPWNNSRDRPRPGVGVDTGTSGQNHSQVGPKIESHFPAQIADTAAALGRSANRSRSSDDPLPGSRRMRRRNSGQIAARGGVMTGSMARNTSSAKRRAVITGSHPGTRRASNSK